MVMPFFLYLTCNYLSRVNLTRCDCKLPDNVSVSSYFILSLFLQRLKLQNFRHIIDSVFPFNVVLRLPKFMPWKDDINEASEKIKASGIYGKYIYENMSVDATVTWSPRLNQQETGPIELEHILRPLIMLARCELLAFFVAFHEKRTHAEGEKAQTTESKCRSSSSSCLFFKSCSSCLLAHYILSILCMIVGASQGAQQQELWAQIHPHLKRKNEVIK